MPPKKNMLSRPHWLVNLLLLVLIACLFAEWLRPLGEITDTHSLSVFLCFFGFVLLLKALRLPWFVSGLLNTGTFFYIVHYLYFDTPFFAWEWLVQLGEQLRESLILLAQWNLAQLPYEVKTVIFLQCIWFGATYLYSYRLKRREMFSFLLLTIIYLASLDTFTAYEADSAMVRTLFYSFLLLALMQYSSIKQNIPVAWLFSSFLLISLFSILGIIAPKAEPQWPDPVGFIQAHTGTSLLVGQDFAVQKVGYGEDDTQLGGGFVQDDSVAFYAITSEKIYWRGEAKDVYTGRGWEQSQPNELYYIAPQAEALNLEGNPSRLFFSGLTIETIHSKVFFTGSDFTHLLYQGDIKKAKVYPQNAYLQVEPLSGRLTMWEDEHFTRRKNIDEYIIESEYPIFSVSELQEVDFAEVPEEVYQRYTQLPESLPARIGALAAELTADLDNPYDKVKAIESYFRRQGYRYETQDVPVPDAGEDYVDQFVFETKRGYCDNFSTAMVVMLRTVDIPARWVKGFTFGEVIERNGGNLYTQVRNKNAHSWVEVYFPGVGWVPFEPTQSFYNPYTFESDFEPETGLNEGEEGGRERETETEEEMGLKEQEKEEQEAKQADERSPLDKFSTASMFSKLRWWAVFSVGSLALGILGLLYYWRFALLGWLLNRYQGQQLPPLKLKGYEFLISSLGLFVMKREPAQTLREYVLTLRGQIPADWQEFIRQYEELRYGRKKDS